MDWEKATKLQLFQLNEMDEFRYQSYESAPLYKERMKQYHDKKILKQEFYKSGDGTRTFKVNGQRVNHYHGCIDADRIVDQYRLKHLGMNADPENPNQEILLNIINTQYKPDPSHVLNHEDIEINEGLPYEDEPVQILDRQVRKLRTKDVASVKVLWCNPNTEEVTWEAEEDMKKIYPQLIPIAGYLWG
ncbi:uncharacterized protein LOC132630963 [Lycium barbarum]|uniref:uncharacterized protein LOC132630963 n=1 Tax=Lycium barbarum TaxID=112863 RepID=UPI00293EB893|nr:uncharacterized protein LOC132630963 [Lycium barbarum]